MLKKPKNKGIGLKSWGIVENWLYFENIKKKNPQKLCKGIKTEAAEKQYRISRDIDFQRPLYKGNNENKTDVGKSSLQEQ